MKIKELIELLQECNPEAILGLYDTEHGFFEPLVKIIKFGKSFINHTPEEFEDDFYNVVLEQDEFIGLYPDLYNYKHQYLGVEVEYEN